MQTKIKIQRYLLTGIVIVVTVYLIFFFKTEITHYRIIQELWNLGHVFLFTALGYLLYTKILYKLKLSVFKEFLIIILAAFVLGSFIEIVQSYTGRDKSFYDVILDTVGATISVALFSKTLLDSTKILRALIMSLIVMFSIASLYPMYNTVVDAINQMNDFPVLLSNTKNNEITRFTIQNAEIAIIEKEIFDNDLQLLRVVFKPAMYSTISLESFSSEWSGYDSLIFSIYNPMPSSTIVILRIHDRAHKTYNNNYNDRYNVRLNLNSGLNSIKIKLSEIRNAPYKREMNMDEIDGLMFFKMDSSTYETFYFSQIQLVK